MSRRCTYHDGCDGVAVLYVEGRGWTCATHLIDYKIDGTLPLAKAPGGMFHQLVHQSGPSPGELLDNRMKRPTTRRSGYDASDEDA